MKVKRAYPHDLPLPARATPGAAGLDLRNAGARVVVPCAWQYNISDGGWGSSHHEPARRVPVRIPTGYMFEIPFGYEGALRGRSGAAISHGVVVIQTATIDSDYRGEVCVVLLNHGTADLVIEHGDRIAQLVIAPISVEGCELAEELSATDRGAGGFGSTGRA